MSKTITICGNLTIDELILTQDVTIAPGGSALFASAAAAYLGSEVNILGNVGEDFPRSSLRWLRERKIDLGLLSRTRAPSTRFRSVQLNGSRRLSLLSPGHAIQRPPNMGKVEGLHLGAVFNEISIPLAMSLVKLCGFLSVDLQGFIRTVTANGFVVTRRRNLDRILKSADMVQASFEEARSQSLSRSRSDTVERLLESGPNYCVLTLGKRGSLLAVESGRRYLIPAFPEEMITDTTGAGDVFAGSWLSTFLSTKDPVWAAAVGSSFASIASQKSGLSKFHIARRELFRRAAWVYNHVKAL